MKARHSVRFLQYLLVILFLFGCNQEKLDTKKLREYFLTDEIHAKIHDNIVTINVSNSKLIQNKRELLRDKWISAEPICSVGAIIAREIINHNNTFNLDSIVINVGIDGRQEKYSFSYKDIKEIDNFLNVCKEFARIPYKSDYESTRPFLGERVLKAASKSQIEEFLRKSFLDESITKTELVGFKIANNMATLYIDYYYASGPQTYAITFALGGDRKIEGIAVG